MQMCRTLKMRLMWKSIGFQNTPSPALIRSRNKMKIVVKAVRSTSKVSNVHAGTQAFRKYPLGASPTTLSEIVCRRGNADTSND